MADQVIVTGPRILIENVIESVSGQSSIEIQIPAECQNDQTCLDRFQALCPSDILGLTLESLPTLTLEGQMLSLPYLHDLLDQCKNLPQYGVQTLLEEGGIMDDEWVIARYRLKGGDEADELRAAKVVAAINCVGAQEYNAAPAVLADPVYTIGRSLIEGNPWIGEGSPWIGEGSPAGDPTAAGRAFWDQWAFGIDGLDLRSAEQRNRQNGLTDYTGEDVRIGVFDSSPFPFRQTTVITTVEWVSPPLTLTVISSEDLEHIPSLSAMSNHGLFVAGLIHGVAPASEIHLYQVLGDDLYGDLFTLDAALNSFISETLADKGDLTGAVINLSLGSQTPHYLEGTFPSLYEQVGLDGLLPGSELTQLLRAEVASLKTLVAAASCNNIAVVAAAGNEAYWLYGKPTGVCAGIPASFEEVIGVSAVNQQGTVACFSDRADIAAPGGDGISDDPAYPCQPALCRCSPLDDCEYGLISLVLRSEEYVSGYAYWAGTSFSAPLVSGLAALAFDAEGKWISPDELRAKIVEQDGTMGLPGPCATPWP